MPARLAVFEPADWADASMRRRRNWADMVAITGSAARAMQVLAHQAWSDARRTYQLEEGRTDAR